MQFVYPNLLYLLLLLGLPILIHLFQLRRYTPVAFTNVAMLQKLKKQSRKSQSLLQWLLLLVRLLIYSCIILSFAQPYFPKEVSNYKQEEYLYYIDNYLSLDAKATNKSLLQELKHEIQELEVNSKKISWFNNTEVYHNQTPKQFLESIQAMQLSPIVKTPKEVKLQAEQLAKLDPETTYKLIWVSDFHSLKAKDLEANIPIQAYALRSSTKENTSIDSLYINSAKNQLTSAIYHSGKDFETTITLYSADKVLGRQKIKLRDKEIQEVHFNINEKIIPQGIIEIEDANIQIDNRKYFSLSASQPIKVYAIGNGENNFLKVFESEEFQLLQHEEKNMNFTDLEAADLLVLYNIDNLSMQLANLIESGVTNGSSLVVIPSETSNLSSYNSLFVRLGVPEFTAKKSNERRLSTIHYEHLLFQGVFERKVEDFKPAFVKQYYGLKNSDKPILSYDTGESFLTQSGNVFLFTATLEEQNTNIVKSPLIVPIFYKMGIQSQPKKKLYQNIGQNITYSIPGAFTAQDMLSITSEKESFIPIQEHKQKGIWITTNNSPVLAGSYRITHKEHTIDWVSYNYPKLPREIYYPDLSKCSDIEQSLSFPLAHTNQILQEESPRMWKWFVIFALLFLGIEILLLKRYR